MLLVSNWYLLRAKFTNDLNFFVREVGRGSAVLERSLEIAEVLRGGGRRWWRQELNSKRTVCGYFHHFACFSWLVITNHGTKLYLCRMRKLIACSSDCRKEINNGVRHHYVSTIAAFGDSITLSVTLVQRLLASPCTGANPQRSVNTVGVVRQER